MSDDEFADILGFEPLNEPFDGGVGQITSKEFDNQLLWSFYERVREELDRQGLSHKPVYAESMVFWSSIVAVMAPATGGHHLNYQPGNGFVFTPHFYDQGRMGVGDLSIARNGAYFANLDQIRDEARFLNLAVFTSEFGMWLSGYGKDNTERVVNGTYQAMESSDRHHNKDRFVDFYTPLMSGAQWQWDIYYNHHHEFQNGNPSKLVTDKDAWNGENFSVIRDYGEGYNVQPTLVERAYPRVVQGVLIHFAYEGLVPDEAGEILAYHAIRENFSGQNQREFLRNHKFAFLVWQGRKSETPTEIYIPRHFDANNLAVITDHGIFNNLIMNTPPEQVKNEVVLIREHQQGNGGYVTLIWDDSYSDDYHFALMIDGNSRLSNDELEQLQRVINDTIRNERSPVYLTNTMTFEGYPEDTGQ